MAATPLAQATMTPFFFGRGGRRLLGLYHAPESPRAPRAAVVFCNPFGQEAIRSHRMFRVLADRVARAGIAALRFDYSATGDSAGDCTEGRVQSWLEDIREADREVTTRSGATHVIWVGLRFGAALALLAAQDPSLRDRRLILWDPVVSGAAYLEELAKAHVGFLSIVFRWNARRVIRSRGIGVLGEMRELVGFEISPELRRDIESVELARGARVAARSATILGDQPQSTYAGLVAALAQGGTTVHHVPIDADAPWNSEEALNASTIPARTLDALLAAVEQSAR
jgi:exosortase A-associated hydrolase 2